MQKSRLLLSTVVIGSLLPFTALAQAAEPNKPVTRAEFGALVREAILNDPEIISDAVTKLREKQEAAAKAKAEAGLKKYHADMHSASNPSVGPKNADVTIVEFFDYHCGYCKHMVPVLAQALKDDPKLRVVFMEFPILSEDSVLAARAALAANRIAPDKYFAYHQALMSSKGKFEEKMLMDTAKKAGIDDAKLKAEMAKPEITAILDKNRKITSELGITGTPAIIMGGEIAPGAVDAETLKKMIAAVRAGKKPSSVFEEEKAKN